jgi:hypothetical protein
MATRITSPVQRRTSLPLTKGNESDISILLESSAYQRALEELSGTKIIDQEVSTSALLHAVFEAGMSAVKASAEMEGYSQIAKGISKDKLQQPRKDARRRTPIWSAEE